MSAKAGQASAARPRLARNQGFRALWTGDVVSQFGSRITEFILPLVVVTTLHGSGSAVGLLQASYLCPYVLLPLLAGVWLEHRAKRPVMVAMDAGRLVLVTAVPVLAITGVLSIPLLYLIAITGGSMTVIYDIALTSYLPGLVGPGLLTSANAALSVNQATSGSAGPAIGGWLSSAFGPVNTLIFDGLSYLASATALLLVRWTEELAPRSDHRSLRREVSEGLRAVFGNPPIRALVLYAAVYNVGSALINVAFLIYFVRDLGHSAASYGVVMMCGGLGAVAGSLGAPPLISKMGYGPALMVTLAFGVIPYFLLPLAAGQLALPLSCVAFFLGIAGSAGGSVIAVTARQLLTPDVVLARMNASYRLVSFGALFVGSLAAGFVTDAAGARYSLLIAAIVLLASAVPVVSGPVLALRRIGE